MSTKENAAVSQLLALLEARYALRVLWALRDGHAQTFRLLQDSVGGITPNTLNTRIKELREAGIVSHGSDGYSLTLSGQDLLKAGPGQTHERDIKDAIGALHEAIELGNERRIDRALMFYLRSAWLYAKLGIVVLLIAYHLYCGRLLADFARDRNAKSHLWYRWFNEVPVAFLAAAVVLAVVKPF